MKAVKIALVGLLALVVLAVGVALTLFLMVRHRPSYYRPWDTIPADERREDLGGFERERERAEGQFETEGKVDSTLTAGQVTAGIAEYRHRRDWREYLDLPDRVRHIQVIARPGEMIVAGEVSTGAGPVVVSVFVSVDRVGGEPRFKVERLRLGSLSVSDERVRSLVERIESFRPFVKIDDARNLRITDITLGDGTITVHGKEDLR